MVVESSNFFNFEVACRPCWKLKEMVKPHRGDSRDTWIFGGDGCGQTFNTAEKKLFNLWASDMECGQDAGIS